MTNDEPLNNRYGGVTKWRRARPIVLIFVVYVLIQSAVIGFMPLVMEGKPCNEFTINCVRRVYEHRIKCVLMGLTGEQAILS